MNVSRRLVSLGRKLCLFVHYVEQNNNKQWMVKKNVALNGGMWSRTMEGRIIGKFENNGGKIFFFLDSIFKR
jgi:hypothetical protein